MKRALVVKADALKESGLEIAPFVLEHFIWDKAKKHSIERSKGVSRKMLKALADELHLSYDEEMITFSKKLIRHYISKNKK